MAPQDTDPPLCQSPDPQPWPPRIKVPAGAWDCHAHIVGPTHDYPLVATRSYTPTMADRGAYCRMLRTLGLARAVIVQPSFYGTDNRCTLDALRAANGNWRGVAVVNPDIDSASLHKMHELGIRGVRINCLFGGGVPLEVLEQMAERVRPLGWHIQLLIDARTLATLAPRLSRLDVDIVFDHMGHIPSDAGIDDPGFQALLTLLQARRCWVKLSGAYRLSKQAPNYEDVIPFAQALIDTAADRLVWASDWPHPAISGPMPNDGALLDLLAQWAPDAGVREQILVTNPARLYDAA